MVLFSATLVVITWGFISFWIDGYFSWKGLSNIISNVVLIWGIYTFTKIDWKKVFEKRRRSRGDQEKLG